MVGELVLRFLLGGAMVSIFAALGEVSKPKNFSGIFGAAPSVAFVTLGLAFATKGADYTALEARSMAVGAVALYLYGALCVFTTKRDRWPVWLGAGTAWLAWFAAAFAIGAVALAAGVPK